LSFFVPQADGQMTEEQRSFVQNNNPELLLDPEFKIVDYLKITLWSTVHLVGNIEKSHSDGCIPENDGEGECDDEHMFYSKWPQDKI